MPCFSLLTTAKSESKDSSIQTRAATTSLQSEADILSESGGNTRLQGTQVKAQNFTVNAGVGPGADPNAKILIEGVKETLQTSHIQKSESVMWQAQSGNGVTEETLKLAQINAKTKFSAPGGIDVQLPAGDPLKEQVQSMSKQPGMEWLNDLSQRKDVNWQEIKLAKDSWSYDQQGLTEAGAGLLAIAIAAYTGGMGAGALGTTGAAAGGGTATTLGGVTLATTTAAGVTTVTAYGAAVNAGFAALASSAGVSFVNNGGDIGKTLKDMGSKDSVKNVVLAMATAGALHGMSETMTIDGQKLSKINVQNSTFGANLGKAVMNNLANATMTSAITGTPLEDNIKTGLVSAFISAGAGSAAFEIGEKTANDQIAKALAHAIAGCVAGAAGQGKGGCSAGATGAVVGELAAQWYDTPTGSKKPEDVLNFVKVVTAAAAAITGDGSAASVSTAVMTGVNAAQNNYLTHAQVDKVKACLNGTTCSTQAEKDKVIAEAEKTSKVLDDNMDSVCSKNPQSDACRTSIEVAIKYVAMQDAWKYMNADVSRSASDTFDYLYNSNGAQPRFVKYLNTIDKRADFFQASDNYEQNNGSGARWFGRANQVSRAPLTGLGAEGNYSAATFAAGSLLPGNQYDWRDAAGNVTLPLESVSHNRAHELACLG